MLRFPLILVLVFLMACCKEDNVPCENPSPLAESPVKEINLKKVGGQGHYYVTDAIIEDDGEVVLQGLKYPGWNGHEPWPTVYDTVADVYIAKVNGTDATCYVEYPFDSIIVTRTQIEKAPDGEYVSRGHPKYMIGLDNSCTITWQSDPYYQWPFFPANTKDHYILSVAPYHGKLFVSGQAKLSDNTWERWIGRCNAQGKTETRINVNSHVPQFLKVFGNDKLYSVGYSEFGENILQVYDDQLNLIKETNYGLEANYYLPIESHPKGFMQFANTRMIIFDLSDHSYTELDLGAINGGFFKEISVLAACVRNDGGILIAGYIIGSRDPYLAAVDDQGKEIWRKTMEIPHKFERRDYINWVAVRQLSDNTIVLVGYNDVEVWTDPVSTSPVIFKYLEK